MVFITKTSQIQAWLNNFYMENLYGQRMASMHVHARRRPGVPPPVMIKCKPRPQSCTTLGAASNTAAFPVLEGAKFGPFRGITFDFQGVHFPTPFNQISFVRGSKTGPSTGAIVSINQNQT